ncbi:MAG: PHP-associated domain-containing protein [Dehalococcoidia bacterium]|nr:PHP-associated domain-containing protein [Dehalococcoidia bacterium]
MTSVFDLHIHTNQGSPDSALTREELVSEGRRLGLTGVMVAEHHGWPRHAFNEFARHQDGIVMVRALEVYTPLGHIITLGLDQHVTGFAGGIDTIRKLRREVDRIGGFMILAHPFRFLYDPGGIYTQNLLFENAAAIPNTAEEAAKHPIFELVDEVEVVNGGNIEQENRFAQEVTRVLGLSGTGGSDAHSVQGLGKGSTMFKGDIRNELDLLEALRAGEFVPVEGFHVGRPTYYGGNSNGGGSPWQTPA